MRLLLCTLFALLFLPGPAFARGTPAGMVEATGEARVSGRPAPAELVRDAAVEASWARIHAAPGATCGYPAPAQGWVALQPGQSCVVSLPVRLAGPGLSPVGATIRIRVLNLGLPVQEADRLFFSNEPEVVQRPGLLYQSVAEPGVTSRLFFHHENQCPRPLRLLVHVTNPNDRPVDCLLVEGQAGPHSDPVVVGHKAAARFLARYRDTAGIVARIPPHSARVLTKTLMDGRETVSGIVDVRPLDALPVVCQVRAEAELALPAADAGLLEQARGTVEVYRPAHKRISGRYQVGGNWLFLDLGYSPVSRVDGERQLEGDYGVTYTIDLELVNPFPAAQEVILSLSPRGGHARASVLLGGKVIETTSVYPPEEFRLAMFPLAPGQTRKITLTTIPEGGSAYPAWLVARAAVVRPSPAAGDDRVAR